MPRTTTKKTKTKTAAKSATAMKPKTVTWAAPELPRPRLWIFIITAYYVPVLGLICLILGNWSGTLVCGAFLLVFFLTYGRRRRTWRYEIKDGTLTGIPEPRRFHTDEMHLDLANYRSVAIREKHTREGVRTIVTLLTTRRLGINADLYLPADDDDAIRVAHELEDIPPFTTGTVKTVEDEAS